MEQTDQADWITPPLRTECYCVSVTSTAAATDISTLADKYTYLTVLADGAKVYVYLASTSATADDLDDTATNTVASPGTTACWMIPDGGSMDIKLDGSLGSHDFLGYKTASGSTAKLRFRVSAPRRRSVP